MLPAILHTIAFLTCLCVQALASPLAGSWLFFHIAGCVTLLYNGKYPPAKTLFWHMTLAWMVTIAASMLIVAPIANSAITGWMLLGMPSLALCLRKEHLKPYIQLFGAVLTLYAIILVAQMLPELIGMRLIYTSYNLDASLHGRGRYAWPLMDPNNAAAVLNIGLMGFAYLTLNRDRRWGLACLLFLTALYATGSRAGGGAAIAGLLVLTTASFGAGWLLMWLCYGCITLMAAYAYRPELIVMLSNCFVDRLPIWEGSWPLIWNRWWGGLGLGSFGYYYDKVRIEHYTAGWYAHNDLLQLTIEMGVPAGLVFIAWLGTAAFSSCKNNILSATIIFVITLMSMVEFQFYVWAISLPMGLVVGYHLLNAQPAYLQSSAAWAPVQPLRLRKGALRRLYAFAGNSFRRP